MKKNTILVVEDDLEIKTLIQFFLEKENYDVITAQNSGKALEMLQNHKPDLVILDIMLPGLNGLEIAKLIKKESHNCKIISKILLLLLSFGKTGYMGEVSYIDGVYGKSCGLSGRSL